MTNQYGLDVLLSSQPATTGRNVSETARGEFRESKRIQDSLLSGPEKRTLLWLAARTPRAINSDHLTALGFLAMILAGAAFAMARWSHWSLLAVPVALALNWLGDSLDGTLARFRKLQRPRYGFYVDHVVDALGTLALFVGMAASGFMTPWVTATLLTAYLLLMIEAVLATYALGIFRISQFRMSPTELRILLAIGALVLVVKPVVHVLGVSAFLLDIGGVIGSVGMMVLLVHSFVRHGTILYREETLCAKPSAEEVR